MSLQRGMVDAYDPESGIGFLTSDVRREYTFFEKDGWHFRMTVSNLEFDSERPLEASLMPTEGARLVFESDPEYPDQVLRWGRNREFNALIRRRIHESTKHHSQPG